MPSKASPIYIFWLLRSPSRPRPRPRSRSPSPPPSPPLSSSAPKMRAQQSRRSHRGVRSSNSSLCFILLLLLLFCFVLLVGSKKKPTPCEVNELMRGKKPRSEEIVSNGAHEQRVLEAAKKEKPVKRARGRPNTAQGFLGLDRGVPPILQWRSLAGTRVFQHWEELRKIASGEL